MQTQHTVSHSASAAMRRAAFKAAFPHTLPIFAGFWFLGITYGIYMNVSGFSFWYPMLMAAIIYGGSLEFICVSMLLSPFAPLETFLVALMVQARHLFYGVSMLEKLHGTGLKKLFIIFGMCDESFSINYAAQIPKGVDRGWFMFFVTLLNWIYWVSGSAIGGLAGSLLTFNTTGLDFAMTALFVVIFLEQFLKEKQHITAYIGLGTSALALAIFGANSFLIPTLIGILLLTIGLKRPIVKAGDAK